MAFRNRILEYGVKPADQFLAHPKNARLHPQFQRDVMQAALDTVGFVAPVIEAKSGFLLDGHERVFQALANNSDVPYVKVDVGEDEESYVLATFDPITTLAYYDTQLLDNLLREVNSDSKAVQRMLSELAEGAGVMPAVEWSALPDGEKAPFQQMTFTLHDNQAVIVREALSKAKTQGGFNADNENSNGNALTAICEMFNGR